MTTGTVVSLRLDRGFGFIRPSGGGADVFFHFKALEGLVFDERLQERRVEFDIEQVGGRLRAAVVKPLEG